MAQTIYKDQPTTFKSHTDGRGNGNNILTFFGSTNSATPLTIYKHSVPLLSGGKITVDVVGLRSDGTEMIRASVETGFRRAGSGNVIEVGTDSALASAEDSAGTPTVTLVPDTTAQTMDVILTGEAAKTIYWEVVATYQHIRL